MKTGKKNGNSPQGLESVGIYNSKLTGVNDIAEMQWLVVTASIMARPGGKSI
ncbi:MAG: hypothetical protein K9N21_02755 [Deltaproteobacteria bacterium]|nr:hypothetical protein [Deltaproteobacteria bacterium]